MIDSHCHLADEAFSLDLDAVIERAKGVGLTGTLCIVDPTNSEERKRSVRVCALWSEVRLAMGVHPHQAGKFINRLNELEQLIENIFADSPNVSAVGEIGLDYHYDFAPREIQQEVFRRQLCFARKTGRPVVIHSRDADNDTFAILRDEGRETIRGVFHCFTGGVETARRVLDLGFCLSFSGIVTFRKAEKIRAAAKFIPEDRIMAETDAPYLAPTPYRGKRNEPSWVKRVFEELATIRQQPVDEFAILTTSTFTSVFGESKIKVEASKGLKD